LDLKEDPFRPHEKGEDGNNLLVEGYVVVYWIKLESLGDHSTRSTSTGDYSTDFSKKSAQFSNHININSPSNDGLHGFIYTRNIPPSWV
jgi:hypothetical protein